MIALSSQMFPDPKLKAFFTDKVLEQKKTCPACRPGRLLNNTLAFYRFPALAWSAMEHWHGGV